MKPYLYSLLGLLATAELLVAVMSRDWLTALLVMPLVMLCGLASALSALRMWSANRSGL